jgi:hypothetical protein
MNETQEIPIKGWVVVEGTLADGFAIWGPSTAQNRRENMDKQATRHGVSCQYWRQNE